MQYQIKNENGDVVASFVNECDCDYSLDALREIFSDCDLRACDGENLTKGE